MLPNGLPKSGVAAREAAAKEGDAAAADENG
jgi:hypothetical protein